MKPRLAVSGLLLVTVSTLIAGCSIPTAGTVTTQPTSTPTQAGEIYSGTHACVFQTMDGGYTVYAQYENVSDCTSETQGLAGDGKYWQPGPASLGAVGTPICTLTSGGITVNVWNISTVDEPIGGGVAQGLCNSLESDDWSPQQ